MRQLEVATRVAACRPDIRVVAYAPADGGNDWDATDTMHAGRALARAEVTLDRDGAEAARFGVRTSGHVLLFDRSGNLAFSGGITPSRGHEGPCAGLDALRGALASDSAGLEPSQTFGCPILDPDAICGRMEVACSPH